MPGKADFVYNPLHYLCWNKRPKRSIKRRLWTATCGLCSSAAAAHGSPDGDRGTARVHPGAAVDFHQHQVEQAVMDALRLSAISFDAVKMLLLARLENRPARLDLTFYPYLPAATVGTTDPRAYLGLIANSASTALTAGARA